MTESPNRDWDNPTLEVRVYRDGALTQRERVETEEEAAALVETWSDVEGARCEVVDLTRDREPSGVLDPRPWEVDAEDLSTGDLAFTDEEEDR